MPVSEAFEARLNPLVQDLAQAIPTPFYVYDAMGIGASHKALTDAFTRCRHTQYFAIKALPNPAVLRVLMEKGSGLDCSSPFELNLARTCGAKGSDIVFTSNNTTTSELSLAVEIGATITFDDVHYYRRRLAPVDVVCFRAAPLGDDFSSPLVTGLDGSKFGMLPHDLIAAYTHAKAQGAERFGIYGMSCANERNVDIAIKAVERLLRLALEIERTLGITFEFVNIGGGAGIPYRPEETPFDVRRYGEKVCAMIGEAFGRSELRVLTEFGRYITGPHGVLVTRVVSRVKKAREIIGLDASMSSLLRPALYGAYHHITAPFSCSTRKGAADVVGSMCENGDRFASAREMILPEEGELLYIHDVGAHAHAMGVAYNGRHRPAEVLLRDEGKVELIRRAETDQDLLATCVSAELEPTRNTLYKEARG